MIIEKELYHKISHLIPIPCVDLLVSDNTGRILMLKRKNPPAKGHWWFPGGRIFFCERRIDSVFRKLKQECGLNPETVKEVGTFDLIFDQIPPEYASHGITTLYHVTVLNEIVQLDDQSCKYKWDSALNWIKAVKHEFLLKAIYQYLKI